MVYSFMVEECILAAYTARSVPCPLHADLLLAQIAPDTVCTRGAGLCLFLSVTLLGDYTITQRGGGGHGDGRHSLILAIMPLDYGIM